jgi:hypothetical protein
MTVVVISSEREKSFLPFFITVGQRKLIEHFVLKFQLRRDISELFSCLTVKVFLVRKRIGFGLWIVPSRCSGGE